MRHSALNRGVMRNWIQVAIEAGTPLPTDPEIMDRFGFTTGDITLRWQGEDRIITLGRAKSTPMESAPRPTPSVTKSDRSVDTAVDRIKDILNRGRTPARAAQAKAASTLLKAAPSPRPEIPAAKRPPAAAPKMKVVLEAPIVAREVVPVAVEPKPRPAEMVPLLLHVPPAIVNEIANRAATAGMTPSALAGQIITAAMSGPGKLLVPAAGFRAAQVAGASLHDFASMLIRRGLQAHLAETEDAA